MRHFRMTLFVALAALLPRVADASECDTPQPGWLACEDFEDGALGWDQWYEQSPFVECNGCSDGTNNPARIRLVNDESRDGEWSLHMPAEESAGFRGGALAWRSCEGEKRSGCTLQGYDQLYWRAWVKLAPDHEYVHHFMSIGGTRPNGYWDGDGNAGCRPNGVRAAGTTVDFNEERELFFYTYYPEMRCDAGGYCSGNYAENICDGCAGKDMPCTDGLECCWGNHFESEPAPVLERDRWVCLEMMMKINTPGEADGEMAFWMDDELGHHETGMRWREVPELQLNKVWVQHYIDDGDADQPNRIWWDDIVISTERIGCMSTPANNEPINNVSPNNGSANNSSPNNGAGNNNTSNNGAGNDGTSPGGNDTTGPGATNGGGEGVPDDDEDGGSGDAEGTSGGCGCGSASATPDSLLIVATLGLFLGGRRRRNIFAPSPLRL